MKHGVFIHDYQTKNINLLNIFNTKHNAINFIDDFINDYITSMKKEFNGNIYREPSYEGSRSYYTYPDGILVLYTKNSPYERKLIKKETCRGYFYNSNKIEKLISIDLIQISHMFNDSEKNNYIQEVSYRKNVKKDDSVYSNYYNVLNELTTNKKFRLVE
jgi:hypothetical protein